MRRGDGHVLGIQTDGHLRKAQPTKTHCPEQVQLMNTFQYIGLSRDACVT